MNSADVLYEELDADAMREAGDVTRYVQFAPSPGFIAINQSLSHLISPPQSSTNPRIPQAQAEARTLGQPKRRRNPIIASYLGLGHSAQHRNLTKCVPAQDEEALPGQAVRKRRQKDADEKVDIMKRLKADDKKAPTQRPVSESLRVIKPENQFSTHKLDRSTEEPLLTSVSTSVHTLAAPAIGPLQTDLEERTEGSINEKRSYDPIVYTRHMYAGIPTNDDDGFGQLCFDFEPANRLTDGFAQSPSALELRCVTDAHVNKDDFNDDDLLDNDLLDLPTVHIDDPSNLKLPSSATIEANVADESSQVLRTASTSAEFNRALADDASSSRPMLKKFMSPVTPTTRLLTATSEETHKPIARPLFPASVRDRSPIIGLTNNNRLRTCFRIGEAINQSCQAIKTSNNIIVELYATVLNSERDGLEQRFTFCDLFHTKPPYVHAVYAAAIWKSVPLFEYDSARLLQQGRLCRCIGTMKRDGRDWVMTVLNIWEATWDDIQWVQGIINS